MSEDDKRRPMQQEDAPHPSPLAVDWLEHADDDPPVATLAKTLFRGFRDTEGALGPVRLTRGSTLAGEELEQAEYRVLLGIIRAHARRAEGIARTFCPEECSTILQDRLYWGFTPSAGYTHNPDLAREQRRELSASDKPEQTLHRWLRQRHRDLLHALATRPRVRISDAHVREVLQRVWADAGPTAPYLRAMLVNRALGAPRDPGHGEWLPDDAADLAEAFWCIFAAEPPLAWTERPAILDKPKSRLEDRDLAAVLDALEPPPSPEDGRCAAAFAALAPSDGDIIEARQAFLARLPEPLRESAGRLLVYKWTDRPYVVPTTSIDAGDDEDGAEPGGRWERDLARDDDAEWLAATLDSRGRLGLWDQRVTVAARMLADVLHDPGKMSPERRTVNRILFLNALGAVAECGCAAPVPAVGWSRLDVATQATLLARAPTLVDRVLHDANWPSLAGEVRRDRLLDAVPLFHTVDEFVDFLMRAAGAEGVAGDAPLARLGQWLGERKAGPKQQVSGAISAVIVGPLLTRARDNEEWLETFADRRQDAAYVAERLATQLARVRAEAERLERHPAGSTVSDAALEAVRERIARLEQARLDNAQQFADFWTTVLRRIVNTMLNPDPRPVLRRYPWRDGEWRGAPR